MQSGVNTEMQKIKIRLSVRLKELRGNRSQKEIANELGVKQQTYSRWELGDRQPKLDEFAALAHHFGVTTDWLLGVEQQQNGESIKRIITIDGKTTEYESGPIQHGLSSRVRDLKRNAAQATDSINKLLESIDKIDGKL